MKIIITILTIAHILMPSYAAATAKPTSFSYLSCSQGIFICHSIATSSSNGDLFAATVKKLKSSIDDDGYEAIHIRNFNGDLISEIKYVGGVTNLAFSSDSHHLYYVKFDPAFPSDFQLNELNIKTGVSNELTTISSYFPGIWLSDIKPLSSGKGILFIYKNGYQDGVFQISLFSIKEKRILWTKNNLGWASIKNYSSNHILILKNNIVSLFDVTDLGLEIPVDLTDTTFNMNKFNYPLSLRPIKTGDFDNLAILTNDSNKADGVVLGLEYYWNADNAKIKIKLPYSFDLAEYRQPLTKWNLINENSAYGLVSTGKRECRVVFVDFPTHSVKELATLSLSCSEVYGFKDTTDSFVESLSGINGTFSDGSGNQYFYKMY